MLCAVAFSMESISIPQIAHFIICPSSCFKVSSTEKILPCQQKSLPLFDKWERILIDYLGYPILAVNLHRYAQFQCIAHFKPGTSHKTILLTNEGMQEITCLNQLFVSLVVSFWELKPCTDVVLSVLSILQLQFLMSGSLVYWETIPVFSRLNYLSVIIQACMPWFHLLSVVWFRLKFGQTCPMWNHFMEPLVFCWSC